MPQPYLGNLCEKKLNKQYHICSEREMVFTVMTFLSPGGGGGGKENSLLCWFPFLHLLSDETVGRHRTFSNESWQVCGKILLIYLSPTLSTLFILFRVSMICSSCSVDFFLLIVNETARSPGGRGRCCFLIFQIKNIVIIPH